MALDASKQALQTVGDYDLLEKVADGGMGSVYRARHRDTGQIVAIKVVAPHLVSNQVLLKRFEQEYNVARQLDHPNIVRALEYNGQGSPPYLVMEFVDGESLGQKLEREGRMPERQAVRLIAQVAKALHRAHKERLIHRDVKPDNILITQDGQAKLTDLGLVKEVEADLNLTRTGRGLGTPHFMAPEQFKNAKNVDARCDIYSLGATLYMMVTGEMPFHASGPLDAYMKKVRNQLKAPRELVPGLSERTDWAIRRAMSPDPQLRPATCREFVEDLRGRSARKLPAGAQGANARRSPEPDIWYVVYTDGSGVIHTVKGGTSGIRNSIRDGLLGDARQVRASRSKKGNFERLQSFAEFRDLLIEPAALSLGPPKEGPTVPLAPSLVRQVERSITPTLVSGLDSGAVPRIELGTRKSGLWPVGLQWVFLLLLVAASALAGFYLLPLLTSK
jgi:serine/threonine protein kinase